MPEIHLPQLRPKTKYQVQLRSTGRGTLSEWSPVFEFTTSGDEVAPAAPQNIVVDTAGDSFRLSWDKVTTNSDGSPLLDFGFYRVVAKPRGTELSYTFDVTTNELIIDYWRNFNAFNFEFQGDLLFEVSTFDTNDNESEKTLAEGLKAATPSPTDLEFVESGDAFVATWTPPEGDVRDYRINITAGSRTAQYWVTGDTWTLSYEDNQAAFGGYEPVVDIEVRTRNSTWMLSEPPATATATNSVPGPPTGLTWAVEGDNFKATWVKPVNNVDGTPFTDFTVYEVSIVEVVLPPAVPRRRVYETIESEFDFTLEMNRAAFLSAKGELTIEVRAKDSTKRRGEPATATVSKPLPPAPTGVTATVDNNTDSMIDIKWTEPASTSGIKLYEVYVAETAAGAGTMVATAPIGSTSFAHQTVAYGQDHIFYLRSVDEFSLRSVESNRTTPAVRPKSPFTIDSTPPATATGFTADTATGRGQQDPSAVDLSWDAVADAAGYHIRYAPTATPTKFQYHTVTVGTAGSTTIEGLISSTNYTFEIRSFDQFINTSGWASDTAISSESTVPPMTEITSDIDIIAGGRLRSDNFIERNMPTQPGQGWMLSDQSLDIWSGRINAGTISTGTMFSSTNVTHDGTTQPAWSLNLTGGMVVSDALVRGKLIVGTQGSQTNTSTTGQTGTGTLANMGIFSGNYGGSGAQWAIKGDGTFDIKSGNTTGQRIQITPAAIIGHNGTKETFNLNSAGALTVDGTIMAAAGDFYGNINVNGHLEVYGGDAYIIARKSGPSGGNWVMLDGRTSTNYAINSSTDRFTVDYDGNLRATNANISGQVTATSGSIGGWTINSTSLSSASGSTTLGNNGYITGAVFSGGTVMASTVRSTNAPGSAYSWALQNDQAFRVWNSAGTQTVLIDMNGNATFSGSMTALSANIKGAVEATSGIFNGTVYATNGSFKGTVYSELFYSRTATSGTRQWIEIGSSGSGDYVDEIRMYANGAVSSIRNPSSNPGSMVLSTTAGVNIVGSLYVNGSVSTNGSWFYTNGGTFDAGSGQVRTSGGLYDNGNRAYSASNPPPSTSHTHDYATPGHSHSSIANYNSSSAVTMQLGQDGTYTRIYEGGTARFRAKNGAMLNCSITGTTDKAFIIDHPSAKKKKTHYLHHSCIEGPTADVYYRGEAKLTFFQDPSAFDDPYFPRPSAGHGAATVELPEYFEDLVRQEGRTVTVTPILGCEDDCPFGHDGEVGELVAPSLGVTRVRDGKFVVRTTAGYQHGCAAFFWEVKGIRRDVDLYDPEPPKSEYAVAGDGPYTYLVPRV